MICSQQESITIGQNVCPSLRGNISSTGGGQMTSLEVRNGLWVCDGSTDAVYVFNTNTNTLIQTVHLVASASSSGVAYVPPQKGSNVTHALDPFTIPPVGNNVIVHMADTSLLVQNKYVFFDGPATFKVVSVGDSTHATLQFANFNGDLTPGSIIGSFVNVYIANPRSDLIYVTGAFPSNFFSVDPDSYTVTTISGLAAATGVSKVYFASVSNCVCLGTGNGSPSLTSNYYSYSIATGVLTNATYTDAAGARSSVVGYSSALDMVYVIRGDPSDTGNNNKLAAYTPSSMVYAGPTFTCDGNVVGFDVAYCPTNNGLYVGAYINQMVPNPGYGQVCVFNASSGARVATFNLPQDLFNYAYGPGSVVFNLTSGLIAFLNAGGATPGQPYPALLYVYSTSNVLVCTVSPTDSTKRSRFACFNKPTGRIYAENVNGAGGGIDYYA